MEERDVRAAITRSLNALAALEPSNAAFGRKVGATPQNVSQWLSGSIVPPYEVLVRIADLYDVSLDTMTGRTIRLGLLPDEAEMVEAMRAMSAEGRVTLMRVARCLKMFGEKDAE